MSESKTKASGPVAYLTVIGVLVAICIYLVVSKNNVANEKAVTTRTMQTQIDSVKVNRDALQKDFDAASAKIDALTSQNVKMDSALAGRKAEMAKLRKRITQILSDKNASAKELAQAREMITSLTDKTHEYEARIAELEKQNSTLTATNQVLVKEVDSTTTVNTNLKKLGSVLHASNLRMEPIHKRRNGKEKETSKAKRTDALHILFDIDENRIADAGSKQLYIRIMAPDGSVLKGENVQGETITSAAGSPIPYSLKKDIVLAQNQTVKDVDVDWNQPGKYQRGDYTIEIYNDGYKVGSGIVSLN